MMVGKELGQMLNSQIIDNSWPTPVLFFWNDIINESGILFRCTLCDTFFSNTGNLEEHIGIKHMGYKNSQEWRVAKKDVAVKQAAKNHEAYEYIKH